MGFPIEKFLDELIEILNINSGSTNVEGNKRIANFFHSRLLSLGYDSEIKYVGEANRPVVVAFSPVGDEAGYDVLLSGHIDTVFNSEFDENGYTVPRAKIVMTGSDSLPMYEDKGFPTVQDFLASHTTRELLSAKVVGQGTVDMKSSALLILYLCEYFIKNEPSLRLAVVLDSDEEIGSIDSTPVLREVASRCDNMFVFEGMRKNGEFVSERKGIVKYELDIQGIASHSGTAPRKGVSAITELAHWVVTLDKLKRLERGTSINVGIVSGGTALNVVAPNAKAFFEVRYTSKRELDRVTKALEKMVSSPFANGIKTNLTITSSICPLTVTPKTQALIDKLSQKVDGLKFVKAGGSSDANKVTGIDIAIIDGCGVGGGFPHSEREFLSIHTVSERFELMKKLLQGVR